MAAIGFGIGMLAVGRYFLEAGSQQLIKRLTMDARADAIAGRLHDTLWAGAKVGSADTLD